MLQPVVKKSAFYYLVLLRKLYLHSLAYKRFSKRKEVNCLQLSEECLRHLTKTQHKGLINIYCKISTSEINWETQTL